ncbi:MAG: hypothetical protein WAP51_00925, partial [Candidatus Sungiibacteriota bacterium]
MKARLACTFLFILLTASFSGCAAIRNELYASFYVPNAGTEMKIHPLGMTVYNQSGEALSAWDWDLRFYTIESAYAFFKGCVGLGDGVLDEKLRNIPIVILPDKPPSGGFDALTDFSFIFVHRDRFTSYRLEHEWLHIYLGLSA